MSSEADPTVTDPVPAGRELVRPTLARRMKWRAETVGYVIFEAGLGLLPLSWVAAVGRVLGGLAHRFLAGRRRVVGRNLRIALAGECASGEIDALTAEVFRRSMANLLCSLRTAEMDERALARAVVLRDEIVFREALARGKGVVVVLAHMGNWEALAQWFPKLLPPGVAGATVYRPLNNPVMNARVVATRARRGLRLFSKDDNPLGMAGFLRRGGALGVLSDQRAANIGELVPFFGRVTSCTPIPAILARRTGAAVVGLSLSTVGAGRWELRCHAMPGGVPSTVAVMRLLETMMRESITDVFWLQDRWRSTRTHAHRLGGKPVRGEAAPMPGKRRRALLWIHTDGRAARPPADTLPKDVDYGTVAREAGETLERFLLRVDGLEERPLDFVVSAASETALRAVCPKLGFGWAEEEAA